MNYLDDHATLRWNCRIAARRAGEADEALRSADRERPFERHARGRYRDEDRAQPDLPPPQTPEQALARIEIPQTVID